MKSTVIAFLFGILALSGFAQTAPADSMLKLLPTARQDTTKVKLLFELVSEYVQTNTDSAILFHQQAKALMDKLNAHQLDFEYYYAGIKIYHATQEFEKALDYNLKAVATAERDKNKMDKADALRALFTIYINLNMDSLAVQTAHQTLRLTEELKDTASLPITFGNLSRLYYSLRQFEKAIFYGKKGIETAKKYKDTKGLLVSLNNVAASYTEMGEPREAEKLFREQLAVAKKNKIPRSVMKALANLAFIHINEGQQNNLAHTVDEINKLLAENGTAPIAKTDLEYLPLFNSYNNLFLEKYKQAEDEALKGISGVKENEELVADYYSLLTKIKYAERDFSKAEWYEEIADSIYDKLDEEDLASYEIEFGKKYEAEKKDAQIKLQQASIKQKNTLNYILIGGALALLTILLLSYRNYRHRRKLQQQRITELETEKQLLATQSLLKGQEEERSRLAKDLHDGLGGLLSGVKLQLGAMKGNLILTEENGIAFNRALGKLDESIAEMRRVAHNMMPEALLKLGLQQALQDYCDGLSQNQAFKINSEFYGLEKRMDGSVEVVLYRIVQELLNNAVKHSNAKNILVQVMLQDDGHVTITVEDDGKGFDTEKVNTATSAGLRNIQSRVNYLNGKMDIQSAPEKGTSIFIDCKIEANGQDQDYNS